MGGGCGRRFNEECNCNSLLLLLGFFGIPGKCSQENGTPENWSGVAGLIGGEESWSRLQDDDTKDEDDDHDEEEENDGVL